MKADLRSPVFWLLIIAIGVILLMSGHLGLSDASELR
jgi:hypothetical protein